MKTFERGGLERLLAAPPRRCLSVENHGVQSICIEASYLQMQIDVGAGLVAVRIAAATGRATSST
jgi:hypothetical protein